MTDDGQFYFGLDKENEYAEYDLYVSHHDAFPFFTVEDAEKFKKFFNGFGFDTSDNFIVISRED